MPYFPLFVSIKNKNILVVGGGGVASRKVEKLLGFEPKIFVVAPKILPKLTKLASQKKIRLAKRVFCDRDLKNRDLVVVAVGDLQLQKKIYKKCRAQKIPCNSVDSANFCSFLFPGLVVRGDFVIGLSSSGLAPGLTSVLRSWLEKKIPTNIGATLKKIQRLRTSLPGGSQRTQKIKRLAKLFLAMNSFSQAL